MYVRHKWADRITRVPGIERLLASILLILGPFAPAFGQPPGNVGIAPDRTIPIPLSELPSPPMEIEQLIQKGDVSLCTGHKPWSDETGSGFRRDTSVPKSRLAAETRFEMNYDYSSKMNWRTFGKGDKRKVRISVNFTKLKLTTKHQIWFRRHPGAKEFWDDRIVCHEFDHVRLSTLPNYAAQFAKNLRKERSIVRPVESSVHVNERYVRRLLEEYVQKEFEEIVDLVTIRYRELDRETGHGISPLPRESSLIEWLKPRAP